MTHLFAPNWKLWLIASPAADLHRAYYSSIKSHTSVVTLLTTHPNNTYYQHACRHSSYNSLCCLRLRWCLRCPLPDGILCRQQVRYCSSKVVVSSWVFIGWPIWNVVYCSLTQISCIRILRHVLCPLKICPHSMASKAQSKVTSTSGHPCLSRHPNLDLSPISYFIGVMERPCRVYCLAWEWLVPTVSGNPSSIIISSTHIMQLYTHR